jgi:hypothetical protein
MYNNMEALEVKVQHPQIEDAVKKLINSILKDTNSTVDKKSNLWDLFEKLSSDSFLLLKKDVYFTEFLSSICITVLPNDGNNNRESDASEVSLVRSSTSPSITTNNDIQTTSSSALVKMPSLSTSLDNIQLPNRFLKLVKRLRNICVSHPTFSVGENFGDLLNLSSSELVTLPNFGAIYIETFEELKLLVKTTSGVGSSESLGVDNKVKFEVSNMRLNLAGVDTKFNKALEKYARHIYANDISEHLDDILKFDRSTLNKLSGFGIGVVNSLVELRDLIKKEVDAIEAGQVNYAEFDSSLIVPKVLSNLSLEKIDTILLEDIDDYFDKISEDLVDIAQRRWGFTEKKNTLEEIATDFNFTREWIRKKEKTINNMFISHLRINQRTLWHFIEPELSSDIIVKLKRIYSCFSSEKDFYDFLGLVCCQERLFEYVYPELDKSILNSYFAENGAPIHIEDVKEYLASLCLRDIRSVDNAIRHLVQKGTLCIEGEHVWPKMLGKAESSACVLANHEKGLPWLDVAKLVNANSYSRSDIYEDRLDTEAFKYPDFIFLAGKGVYKHTKFIDVDSISLDDIFLELMEYAESNSRNVFHLNECYHASSYLRIYDYYVIRHFVKEFGEDFGFYFEGRSQTDSVGLEKGFKNITQKDVIIEAMNRNERPLTKPEIANFIKSKSLHHAALYLDCLIDEGKVVQIDRMLYTTPDLAYKKIDINEYIDAIDAMLREYAKPVEPSIFKEELNIMFSNSYSKYFYMSIARLYAERQGWFRKQSLYSIKEIPFKNLNAALDCVGRFDLSANENIATLQVHIAITRETAAMAVTNWRNMAVN